MIPKAHGISGPYRRNRQPRRTPPRPSSQPTEHRKDILPNPWRRSTFTTPEIFSRETTPSSQLPQTPYPPLRSQRSPPRPQPRRLHNSHIINNPHHPLRLARKLPTRPSLLHPLPSRPAEPDPTIPLQHPPHARTAHLLQLRLRRTRHARSSAYPRSANRVPRAGLAHGVRGLKARRGANRSGCR